jgi:hypothetical protein
MQFKLQIKPSLLRVGSFAAQIEGPGASRGPAGSEEYQAPPGIVVPINLEDAQLELTEALGWPKTFQLYKIGSKVPAKGLPARLMRGSPI